MKPKVNRKTLSKKRQELGLKLRDWKQKIREVEIGLLRADPGAAEKMAFCRSELEKTVKAMRRLNTRQRAWATHGFLG